jgi:hypothetical protein
MEVSGHALVQMKRRQIARELVEETVRHPNQKVIGFGDKSIYQSRITDLGGKEYLIRVVVYEKSGIPHVVTVYRTTKIKKYWRLS